jgi:hypothetical protein
MNDCRSVSVVVRLTAVMNKWNTCVPTGQSTTRHAAFSVESQFRRAIVTLMKREEPDVLRSRSLASLEGEELVEVDRLRAFGLRICVEKVAWLISPRCCWRYMA